MKLINIALSSLNRQKSKKGFLMIALILGAATVVSLFTFINTQKNKIENQFDEFGANIIITPKSDNLSLTYGGINVSGVTANLEEMKLNDIQKIWDIPNKSNIRSVSPKILNAAKAKYKDEEKNILIVGVYFNEEKKIKTWWEINGRYPENKNEVIIGSEVSKKLELENGSKLFVMDNEIIVSGVLKSTGSQDDNIIFSDFNYVSSVFNKKGSVSLVEVSALCSDCPIDTIISQINTKLPGADIKGIRQIMKQKMDTINQFGKFAITITFVIILIGSILVFTSMMGAVAERKHEIGIFRAIGFKKSHIISIILSESMIICIIAGIIGVLAGMLISFFLLPLFTQIDTNLVKFNSLMLVITFLSVIILGLVATLYPAYTASEVDPVKTLNSL